MDVSITAKPQTLASSVSLSSQFYLPSSVRREFLGCATHLRPPGLRSRPTTKRRLGLRIQSPRCLFNNPMDDDSILVVAAAVASFAMMQLIYLNYSRLRRNAPKFPDDPNVSVMVSREPHEQNKDALEHEAIGIQPWSSESLCEKPFERDNSLKRGFDKASDSDIKNTLLESQKAVLAWERISFNGVEPGYELAYSPTDSELPKTNGLAGLTSSSVMVNDVKTMERGNFAAKMPNLLLDMEKGITGSTAPTVVFEPVNSVTSEEKESGKIEHNKYELGHIPTKHSEMIMSSDDAVKEVSNYREGKQLALRSISHLKRLSTKPHHLAFQDNTVNHSPRETVPEGSDILAESSLLTEVIGCLKEGPVIKENESTKAHGFRDNGIAPQNKSTNGDSRFPQQNGFARNIDSPTSYIRNYNCHLKDGRLRDCVDLLERMEAKGLLDMNKVHHSTYLKACKSQRAVKEAFRFCRLIPKPTLSTFNMLLSVCASSQDFDGAFQAMLLVKEAGLKPDCKLYTTLISTCAKSGKVDAMFEVFHEMVNAGVEANVNTYGALIDGCARAGQVAKAFGAYGIMRSKKVQPDRVIFNALITACGQSGAADRAFDVLAEMRAEAKPIDPDHVTVGALIKTCIQAGQVDRVREVYKMLHTYSIRGTPDVYTIAVNSCSQTGDLEFALTIYNDMKNNGVVPDEIFLSTLIDVAGHAGKVDTAFEILRDARKNGIRLGNVSYSSLMGACCNAKNWQKALELYEEIKAIELLPTVSTLNALITSLCDVGQLLKSVEILDEMKEAGVEPNIITYSTLIVACEKKDEAELGFMLLSKAKQDGILPNLIMCRCLTGLCLKSSEKARSLGEPIISFNSGKPQIDSKWASRAIMVYRETISAGVIPTIEVFSQVLGCLQFPRDSSLRNRFVENLGIYIDASRCSNICALLDGFGEYDTRSFSVLEEAASLGVIPHVSFKDNPIVVDARKLLIHTVEVYLLTILKGLKHRLVSGARLPNITILLPIDKTQIESSTGERRTINVAGRIGQAVGSLLRRLGLTYSGDASYGKIRISGLALRRWFKPKLPDSPLSGRPGEMISVPTRLAKRISDQQRNIRSSSLHLE